MKKRILAMLMCIVLMIGIMPVSALAVKEITSGKCGKNLTWKLTDDGMLTISGKGTMYDYDFDTMPWYKHVDAIRSVVIEKGVTSIGNNAFTRCVNMSAVTIPDGVTRISDYAFYGCEKLPEIIIPDSVVSIGQTAFYECNGLTEITIPDGIKAIEMWTFGWCDNLTTVNIPDSVSRIEELAFYNCISLTDIVIPDGVTTINNQTFSGCESLISVVIPDSVINIGDEAFAECRSLTEITIPNGVTTIGDYAFAWCDSLTSFEIPASVVDIIGNAFNLCISMEEYIVDENNRFYSSDKDGVLFNKDKSVLIQAPINGLSGSYVIPDGVRAVEYFAFDSCAGITDITIPSSVTNAGSYTNCDNLMKFIVAKDNPNYSNAENGALLNKDMSELIYVPGGAAGTFKVPASVTKLGRFAFTDNYKLTAIEFVGDAPSFDGNYLIYRYILGYYPENNPTWTEEMMQSYGDLIAWIPYTPDLRSQGDVNGDGKITNSDLVRLARYLVEWYDADVAADIRNYGDVNGDGRVTNSDLVRLARVLVGE